MKWKAIIPIVLLMTSAFLLRLNHWPPFRHAASIRIKFERDVPDISYARNTSPAMSGYDPYFIRVNKISANFDGTK